MYSSNSRRQFVKDTSASLGLLFLPQIPKGLNSYPDRRRKIACAGGHPDDPESGCGGTLARLQAEGHEVTVIYLITAEAGIEGKDHEQAARIRKQKSVNACKILNAGKSVRLR